MSLPATKAIRRLRSRGPRACVVACVLALVLVQTGCVQRRLMIRTNPPGAMVYIDDYEIGTTPVATDYTYYGTRKIRIVKDGYETLTVMQPVKAPWYEIFPLEFVSENIIPWEIRDERALDYNLVPQVIVPADQLLSRAENLRQVTRASATGPIGAPPAPTATVLPPPPASAPVLVPSGPRTILPPQLEPPPQYQLPAPTAPSLGPALPPAPVVPPRQPSSGLPF